MDTSTSTIMSGTSERKEMNFWGQALLLFHKTWLTKRRQDLKKLFGEIGVPIIYLAFLCLLVRLFNVTTYPRVTESYETPQNVLRGDHLNLSVYSIHVVPNTNFTRHFTSVLMQSIWSQETRKQQNHPHYDNTLLSFEYHETEEELVTIYGKDGNLNIALILPASIESSSSGAMKTFPYKIRMNPELKVPSPSKKNEELKTCRDRHEKLLGLEDVNSCPVNGYYFSNFLALQSLVDQAVMSLNESTSSKNFTANLDVTMENYPKDAYKEGMPVVMRILIPLYSVLPLVQIVNNLLVLIATEKEHKIKDGLRMIGVSDAAYWFSWLGVYGLIVTLFAVAFTVIMFSMKVLSHFNPLILFLLFFFFGISVITFAFALTPLFHKPKTAGLVGTLVMQFLSLLFLVQTFVDGSGNTVLMPFRLISSLAFTTALDQACRYEYAGGIGWTDLVPGNRGDTILYSLIFLIFDTFFYAFLAFYLDNVLPNEFGVKKHPLFFVKPSFWVGSNSQNFARLMNERELNQEERVTADDDNFERVPENLRGHEAIRIRKISKTYTSWFSKASVQAVNDVSMNMYEGQITAILGKNGAGKSTLFHILTGLVSPTDGTAVIFGLNSNDAYDMARLRKMTGVCLQYDLHFNALTVEEHLKFYGKLRGLQKDELTKEINTILHDLKLNDRRHVQADKLSGGQKRKLSVGISLIGDPKIILLDEPTAGLDPASRRHLWSILQQKKEGKVIILTTHFLDEADILADRKAIIHDGVLRCMGSSLFLKNRYGVGYCLTVELNDPSEDLSKSDGLIKKWIPQSLTSRKVFANEVKYSLPHAEAAKFSSIFSQVEDLIQDGTCFKSYGVSMTTLEEVFLKISNDLDSIEAVTGDGHLDAEKNLMGDVDDGDVRRNTGAIVWSMCKLRIRRLMRSPQGLFFMMIMPLVLMSIGLGVPTAGTKGETTLNLYDPPSIYSQSDLRVAVHEEGDEFKQFLSLNHFEAINYTGDYENLLDINPGVGTMAAVSIFSESNGFVDEPPGLAVALNVNGTFPHSPGIMLGLITKYFSLKTDVANGITSQLTYQPFAERNNNAVALPSLNSVFFLGIAFLSTAVGMVMEIVLDREIKARNHLRVNSLSFGTYFSSVFIVYGALTLFLTIAVMCLVYIFQVEAFMNPYAMVVITVLLILYIFPSLLFSACFSYLFNRMDSAQSVFSQVATFFGFLPAIAVIVIDAVVTDRIVVRVIHTLFSALDIFYIPYGIFYFTYKEYLLFKLLRKSDDELSFSMYATPEILTIGICMIIQIPVFWILLLVADVLKNGGNVSEALTSLLKFKKPNTAISTEESDAVNPITDSDVVAENSRVENHFSSVGDSVENNRVVVAVKNLRKTYKAKKKSKQKQVLNGVSFLVEKGGVFGLLGHNGAGKTTTMKIITAEEAPDHGSVQLCGYDIRSNVSEGFQKLGFCPQHDALWDNITLREHLELYATIRGIPLAKRNELVEHFLQGLNIKEHEKKAASKLSGGTKRKLSYAMSMLGRPDLVLLDEPSTGMDPQSKRFLWNTVLGTFKDSRGAILTTHAIEEADVLCSRIAIMVNGAIICIGSPQHLKSKFGTGYSLEIKLKPEKVMPGASLVDGPIEVGDAPTSSSRRSTKAEIFSRKLSMPMVLVDSQKEVPPEFGFVIENFPSAILVENFGNRAVFSVPNAGIQSISQVFRLLEELKSTNNVEEYSFSQTTLEQVFLTFATDNDENEEH